MNEHPEDALIRQAKELQRQANSVLEKSGIRCILSAMGHVELVGSYSLGLLVRPDLDITVTSESPERAIAVNTTKQILDEGYFQSVVFIDHFTFRERLDAKMSARGFYWHLDVPEVAFGRQWKMDVWYLRPEENWFRERTRSFRERLDASPEARKTILELKAHFLEGNGYRNGLKGGVICEAVLEHGLRTPGELVGFAERKA